MTDEVRPSEGGSYIRQPDGSLLRNQAPVEAKESEVAQTSQKSKTRGK